MKKITYLAPVFISAIFFSCAGTKPVAGDKPVDEGNVLTSRISSYKKMEFERYFFEGIKERDAGNYQRAAQQFEKAIEMDPGSGVAQYELGRANLQLGHLSASETSAIQAVKLDPDNKWYEIFLADIYKYERKWTEGAAIYQKLIEAYPDEPDYYQQFAAYNLQAGKINEAIHAYDLMEKQFGATEDIILQKHRIYFETGKTDKAVEEINKLITQEPDNARYYQILAETYLKAGDTEKAYEVYKKLLEKNPDDGATQLALAEYYYRKGDKEQGFDILKKAFGNASLDIDKKISILYNYYLMKDHPSDDNRKEGYALAEELVKTHPDDAKTHAIYGDFLYQDKKLDQAKDEYHKSLAIRKDVFAVWQQLFFIEAEQKDYTGLEAETQKALEFFPSQPMVYFFSGVAKSSEKKYQDAVADFETGLGMVVDNPQMETQFYVNMAEAYNELKDYQNSDASFEKALAIEPDNALALNNYAYYLSVRNAELDKAEQMSKKSLDKDPGNASYLDTYGWILYKEGHYSDAAKYIKQSLDKDPANADVLEHYGDVMFRLGDTESAVNFWKKAKQSGSGSVTLEKKIEDKKLYE